MMNRWRNGFTGFCLLFSMSVSAVTNQVPNPELRGTAGVIDDIGGTEGTITGDVPTLWRAFVRGGGELDLQSETLPANTLFPGSPAVQAITMTVSAFADAQGFDTSPTRFSVEAGRPYDLQVYMRSANPSTDDQDVSIALPLFDSAGVFTGENLAALNTTVTTDWQAFGGPAVTSLEGTSAELAFRLTASGTDNAIQIALPIVNGVALANQAPNPGFEGANGAPVGMVSGMVPDLWRAFAVGGGDVTVGTEPVAADALYPGSPATQAMRLTVNSFGTDQGFDNEQTLFQIVGGRHYQGQVYLRSGNQDMSDVSVGIGLNVFDATPAIVAPIGTGAGFAGAQWSLFSTNSVRVDDSAALGSLAVRVVDNGSENSVLIALPKVLGPDLVFVDGFEE